MRNMLLSAMIVAAVGAGGCGGGADTESVSPPTPVESENSAAIEDSEIASTSANNAGQVAEALPSTASWVPLIGALGMMFVAAAAFSRRQRQQREHAHLRLHSGREDVQQSYERASASTSAPSYSAPRSAPSSPLPRASLPEDLPTRRRDDTPEH
jgi:hypothetical protein